MTTSAREGGAETAGKSRIATVDFVRALAIAGVALEHASGILPVAGAPRLDPSDFFRPGVPLFFVFWSLFLTRSCVKQPEKKPWLSRLGRYACLYAAWTAVYVVLSGARLGGGFSFVTRNLLGSGWSGQYFLLALMLWMPVFPWLLAAARRIPPWVNIGAGVLAFLLLDNAIGLPYPLDRLTKFFPLWWAPPIVLGVHLAQGWRPRALPGTWVWPVVAGLAVVDELWVGHRLSGINGYATVLNWISTSLLAVTAFSQTLPVPRAGSRIAGLSSVLASNTMAVYFLNPMGLVAARHWFPGTKAPAFPGSFVATPLIVTVLVVLGALAVAGLLRRLRLGALVDN
jgi:hypothetical protein